MSNDSILGVPIHFINSVLELTKEHNKKNEAILYSTQRTEWVFCHCFMKYLVEALSGPLGKHKKLMRIPPINHQQKDFKRLGLDRYNNHRLICAVSCLLADKKNESALSFLGMTPDHGTSAEYSRLNSIHISYGLKPWEIMRDNLDQILNLHDKFADNTLLSSYIDKLFALFSDDNHLHAELPHGILHVLSFHRPQEIKKCVYVSEPMGEVHALQKWDFTGNYLKKIILHNNSIHADDDFSEDTKNRQFRIDVAQYTQEFNVTRHYLPGDKEHFDKIKRSIKKLALDLISDLKSINVLCMKQLSIPAKVLSIHVFNDQTMFFRVLINHQFLTIEVDQNGHKSILSKALSRDSHDQPTQSTHFLFKSSARENFIEYYHNAGNPSPS
tara:strand:+ start:2142 stop:3296 length:1155 start_codon:yes stop_codon:yes gene_type:complete